MKQNFWQVVIVSVQLYSCTKKIRLEKKAKWEQQKKYYQLFKKCKRRIGQYWRIKDELISHVLLHMGTLLLTDQQSPTFIT